MNDSLKKFLASGFGLGLLPLVPGSFGALVGLAWHLMLWRSPLSDRWIRCGCLAGVIAFSAIHYWLTPWAQRYWNDSDPKNFVMDEIVGYLCVPIFVLLPFVHVWQLGVAFCLFRIFDAIKLPGARYIDRNIHTANGVLFDDVVSAAYTALVMSGMMHFT